MDETVVGSSRAVLLANWLRATAKTSAEAQTQPPAAEKRITVGKAPAAARQVCLNPARRIDIVIEAEEMTFTTISFFPT